MPSYRVAFDSEWQGDFDTLAKALRWAEEVSATGRTTWVVERRPWRREDRLCATFPHESRESAERAWGATHRTSSQ